MFWAGPHRKLVKRPNAQGGPLSAVYCGHRYVSAWTVFLCFLTARVRSGTNTKKADGADVTKSRESAVFSKSEPHDAVRSQLIGCLVH